MLYVGQTHKSVPYVLVLTFLSTLLAYKYVLDRLMGLTYVLMLVS